MFKVNLTWVNFVYTITVDIVFQPLTPAVV